MIAVENDMMQRLAFLEVLEHIAAGNTAELEKAGLSKDAIKRIRKAHASDVPSLSRMMKLAITIDPRNLETDFSRAQLAQEEMRALEYYVLNHATPSMIKRYFKGIHDGTIRDHRDRLSVRKKGRSPELDHKTAVQVFDAWVKLSKLIDDERQRYIALHKDFPEWPLSALYSAINETDSGVE